MVEMKVDTSDLKGDQAKMVEKLVDFLKEKTGGEVAAGSKVVTVKGEGEGLSKKYVRITLKKFLYKYELSELFKVISPEGDTLKIKERKLEEED
jgi:hypothetical protein